MFGVTVEDLFLDMWQFLGELGVHTIINAVLLGILGFAVMGIFGIAQVIEEEHEIKLKARKKAMGDVYYKLEYAKMAGEMEERALRQAEKEALRQEKKEQ